MPMAATALVMPSTTFALLPKNQTDVPDLAARLELGATNAYLGVIPTLGSGDLAQVAASLAADETMHFIVLNQTLGRPVPAGALGFGV